MNQGDVEVVLAIRNSLHTSFMEGWWCRASALAFKVKPKAKLNYFSSTATELGVVVTNTTISTVILTNTSNSTSSNLRKSKATIYW